MSGQFAEEHVLEEGLRDPSMVIDECRAVFAEESLYSFVEWAWPILEPRRKLVKGWVLECLCEHLEALHRGELPLIMINIPPGCMKSLMGVFFNAWEWGPKDRSDLRWVSWSYTQHNTKRDNQKVRDLIRHPRYLAHWGDRVQLRPDRNQILNFGTMATGYRIAASVGGVGTGERGDRLWIDDPHKVKDVTSRVKRDAVLEWFSNEITTRVNEEDSALCAIGQRTHQADMFGLILREELGFEWLCLPMEFEEKNRCFTSVPREGIEPERRALVKTVKDPLPRWVTEEELADIRVEDTDKDPEFRDVFSQDRRHEEGAYLWPERYSPHYVETRLKRGLRAVGGNYAVAGQLQQRPSPREGGLFQEDDFHYLDAEDVPSGIQWVRGWDLAGTDDDDGSPWTAGVLMGRDGDDLYVRHVRRERLESRGVYEFMLRIAERDGPATIIDFPQDPGQAGKAQRKAIAAKLQGYVTRSSPETGSKYTRAEPLASEGQAGNLYLVRGDWNEAFVAECTQFPMGDFSDMVDAASRAYARIVSMSRHDDDLPVGPEEI